MWDLSEEKKKFVKCKFTSWQKLLHNREYKKKDAVVGEIARAEIVEAIRYVDKCIIADTLDKTEEWEKYKFNAVFIGDD